MGENLFCETSLVNKLSLLCTTGEGNSHWAQRESHTTKMSSAVYPKAEIFLQRSISNNNVTFGIAVCFVDKPDMKKEVLPLTGRMQLNCFCNYSYLRSNTKHKANTYFIPVHNKSWWQNDHLALRRKNIINYRMYVVIYKKSFKTHSMSCLFSLPPACTNI